MKKKKKTLLKLISSFAIIGMSITGICAASYSLPQDATVSSNVGSAKVRCIGTYYSSGNTRWNRSWVTLSASELKATYISSTMTIPSDPYMNTTGKISMTNYNYQTSTAKKTFKYKFNGSKVVKN